MSSAPAGLLEALSPPHAETATNSEVLASQATLVLLIATGVLYALCVRRLWRGRRGAGISSVQAVAFGLGLVSMGVALASPLSEAAHARFAAHMAQHLLLLAVAPPLLLYGRLEVGLAMALPARWRRRLRHVRMRRSAWSGHIAATSIAVLAGYTLVVWVWHLPPLYDAAYRHEPLHLVEHATFFVAGCVFWLWAGRLAAGDRREQAIGIGVLLAAMFPGLLLGAMLTFAGVPLYASQQAVAVEHGIDALVDQQAGGLLMLMPAGLVFVAAALHLLMRLARGAGFDAPLEREVSTRASRPRRSAWTEGRGPAARR